MTNESQSVDKSETEIPDLVEAAIQWHQGDRTATIATLIEDCRFLREQLAIASALISHGMRRGWQPKFDRD